MKAIAGITLFMCAGSLAYGQSAESSPKFEAAQVRVAAKTRNAYLRTGEVHNGRYQIKTATLVDLIQQAYDYKPDKIVGGPSWIEMDRFDVTAKVPPDTTPETQKLMLQALLAERFNLKVHKDNRPLPTYALVAGKKPQLKEAAGTEETGCKPKSGSGSGDGPRVMIALNGNPITLALGPGMAIQYHCRNMTMAAFAAGLSSMFEANVGPNPIVDDTGLKGKWNFDVQWSLGIFGPLFQNSEPRISSFEAIEKQLGLKLEERQVSTPVLVVDAANEKPAEDPPGTADILPPMLPPTEFDVVSVKASDPNARGGRFQILPGGRLSAQNMPLRIVIMYAFNGFNSQDTVGVPDWASKETFDIEGKAPASAAPPVGQNDLEWAAPMLRALLADRFKMTYHTEDRPATAYSLIAAKPKLKKADPNSRTFCKRSSAPPPAPPGTVTLTCQNATMAQLADSLQGTAQELTTPVADATELTGGWDLALTYSAAMVMPAALAGRGGGDGAAQPAASDPTGGLSVFDALEKELGLKLEKGKRAVSTIVIDHIEPKPTEN